MFLRCFDISLFFVLLFPEWPVWAEPTEGGAAALKHQCLEMLAYLGNADEFGAFTEPVPETETGYVELIEEPIDLTTMARIAKADGYGTLQDFRKHVALLISNALTWHPKGTDQHEDTMTLWRAAQDAYIATGGVEKTAASDADGDTKEEAAAAAAAEAADDSIDTDASNDKEDQKAEEEGR